jgi:hypothetical protein
MFNLECDKVRTMKIIKFSLSLIISLTVFCVSAFSQIRDQDVRASSKIIDSLMNKGIIYNNKRIKPEIVLSKDQAIEFLKKHSHDQSWKNPEDPFRAALDQLIYQASHSPFDSSELFLRRYPFDSLNIPWEKFYRWEPLRLKIPVLTPPEFHPSADSIAGSDTNRIPAVITVTQKMPPDADSVAGTDTMGNRLKLREDMIVQAGLKDTVILVVIDTLDNVTSNYKGFPFRFLRYPYESDSIRVAVNSLLKYIADRDSSIINFTDISNVITPVWINSKSEKAIRYWLKNEFSDSVTVWIGNPARNTIGLYLEHGVSFRRPVKQGDYSGAKVEVKAQDKSKLQDVKNIAIKPRYWKYRSESAFFLNQASLTNWVKGGENSISAGMDITGYADYNNKVLKVSSSNFARLKLGFLTTGDSPIRKNLDLLETNSKLNHKAFGKFDFSGILLFKTQVAPGYNYPNDSVMVSKFMNPAILTIGLGLDYKPDKTTSINFSPLSYKGTFVPDTAHIDQTRYGIPKDKRSLNEPGASFMISNEFTKIKNISIVNRLQLFTNYIKNPLNVDVDWEMIVNAKINWFTDVRFNTHLIFDDDTKTVILGKDKKPVLRPDGTQKKTARIQFKEMLGFSFVFRF